MLEERQKTILKTIIREYIKTAMPVSSGGLVEKYKLDLSPATVRNEMMALEEAGYIFQPHTSAGRIPTPAAYELYVNEFLDNKRQDKLNTSHGKELDKVFRNDESGLKQTAKALAELSSSAVFWAFHKNDFYHTGLSNLFSQEEFKQVNLVYDVSAIIDRLEEIIDHNFANWPLGVKVLIGDNNPFGGFLSVTLLKYNLQKQTGVLGILGPLRADYENNLALIKYIEDKLNSL